MEVFNMATEQQVTMREPIAKLLNQFGLPVSSETVQLVETLAEYAWASDVSGGKEAVAYLTGLRAISLLFHHLGDGEDDSNKLRLIYLLRMETIKGITDYVNSHQRLSKANLEGEVQRRLGVFAQQVVLIHEGIITWKGTGAVGPPTQPPASFPPPASSGSGRGGGGTSSGRKSPAKKPAASSSSSSSSSKPVAKQPEKGDSSTSVLSGLFGSRSGSDSGSGKAKQQPTKAAEPTRQGSTKAKSSRQEPAAPRSRVSEPQATVAQVAQVEAAPEEPSQPPPPVQRPSPQQLHPTVLPADNFDADADVQALRKAMKGMGCDDKAVISVLAFRSNGQRQEICKRFKAAHGKDLPAELEGELRGSVEDVALALVKTAYEYDAYLLRKAMKGLGTDEKVLVELFASRTSSHLRGVCACFQEMYGKDLVREVKSETSGDFQALMLGRLTKTRSDSLDVDDAMARDDAQALYHAGEGKRGTNEEVFIDIFTSRSHAQLFAMLGEYERISKKTMVEAISSETSGDIKSGLKAIVKCARDLQAYFAELLYKSMEGAGTNDDQLIRCVVTRCEIDMVEIKGAFQQRYGKTLKSWIEGDAGGNYKRFLLALIGE